MSKFAYLYADPTTVTQSVGATPYGLYDNDSAFQSLKFIKMLLRKI